MLFKCLTHILRMYCFLSFNVLSFSRSTVSVSTNYFIEKSISSLSIIWSLAHECFGADWYLLKGIVCELMSHETIQGVPLLVV